MPIEHMPILSRRTVMGGAAALAATTAFGARASAFPQSDVGILLGVGPGGGTDRSARLFGPHWADALPGSAGVSFIPKPGASGLLALNEMLGAQPDGLTTMYFPAPHIASLFSLGKVEGRTIDDVAWIGALFNDPNVLLVPNDSPYETIADFIAAAREADEPFTISGSTPLSNAHFSTVLVRELTGAKLKFVPFGGGGDARNAVAGGHVDGCLAPYWSALGVLELTRAIGIFQDANPAPDLWQPVPVNEVLDVEIPNLSEPYAMFCSAAVREQNPDAYATLVSSFSAAVGSESFREAAKAESLTEFLVNWDGDRMNVFVEDYNALVAKYMPAMQADLADM